MRVPALSQRRICAIAVAMLLIGGTISPVGAQSRTQLVVGVTDNINSYNPIADSAAFMASVWSGYTIHARSGSELVRCDWDDPFLDAKIIMFLSHHVAFVVDQRVIVLPTSEITRVMSQPIQARPAATSVFIEE